VSWGAMVLALYAPVPLEAGSHTINYLKGRILTWLM